MPGYLTIPEYSAQNISVNPAGNLSSNNIQNALEELDGDLLSGLAEKLGITTASNTYLPIAGGKILQIVRATDSTTRTTTSSTVADANLSVTITPQKSDSAVLLVANFAGMAEGTTNSNLYGIFYITDASNNTISGATEVVSGGFNHDRSTTALPYQTYTQYNIVAWATPATTSATTYKLRWKSPTSDITVAMRNAITAAQLYAIEVSA